MNQPLAIQIIAGLMALVLIGGALARRRLPAGRGLALAAIWVTIIGIATLPVIAIQKLIG